MLRLLSLHNPSLFKKAWSRDLVLPCLRQFCHLVPERQASEESPCQIFFYIYTYFFLVYSHIIYMINFCKLLKFKKKLKLNSGFSSRVKGCYAFWRHEDDNLKKWEHRHAIRVLPSAQRQGKAHLPGQ